MPGGTETVGSSYRTPLLLGLLGIALVLLGALAMPVAGADTTSDPGEGEVDIALEPADETVEPGEIQVYDIVVDGPDNGIKGYNFNVTVEDPEVAEIVGYTSELLLRSLDDPLADGPFLLSNVTRDGQVVGPQEYFPNGTTFESQGFDVDPAGDTLVFSGAVGDHEWEPAEEILLGQILLEGQADQRGNSSAIDIRPFVDGNTNTLATPDGLQPTESSNEILDLDNDIYTLRERHNATVSIPENPNFTISNLETDEPVVGGADLTVNATVTNTGEKTGTQTVTAAVGDLGSDDSSLELAPEESSTETFTFSTTPADADEYTATVTTENDSDSQSVTVLQPATPDLSGLTIAGDGDDATILEGEDEDVNVTVANVGEVAGTFTVVLDIDGTEWTETTGELAAGGDETVTFEGVTGEFPPDTYDVTASDEEALSTVSGSLTVDQEATPALSNLDIAGDGDDATILEGENEGVSVTVDNVGDRAGTFTVVLDIDGTEWTETTDELAAGADETVTFEGVTGEFPPDTYDVTASDDEALSTVSGSLTVDEEATPALSNLDISGEGSEATITEGSDEDVSVTVDNVGDRAGTFSVVLDIDGTEWTETTDELAGGADETVTFEGVTGDLSAGTHDVTVSAEDASLPGELTVQAPAESSLSDLDIAGQGAVASIPEESNRDVSIEVENIGDLSGSFDVDLAIGDAVSESQSTTEISGGESETVTFENVTGELTPGEYGVDITTVDDTADGSLTVKAAAESSLSNLTIADDGETAVITAGDDEDVAVNVTNVGDLSGIATVQLTIGDEVETSESTDELDAGQTQTVTFPGVTGDLEPGTYAVTTATDDDTESGTLTVEQPPIPSFVDLDIDGQGETASITEGETVDVSAVVQNVGDQAGSFEVGLAIDGYTWMETTDTIGAGENATVTFETVTGDLPPGSYDVTVTSQDAEREGALTVQAPAEPAIEALDIVGQGLDAVIPAGSDAPVTVDIQNVGDLAGSFEVSLEIGDAVAENRTTDTIEAEANDTVTFTGVTDGLDPGEYTVTVSTANDTETGSLDVQAPAESDLSALDIAGDGATASITEGENESVAVDVTNVGEQTGLAILILSIGDAVQEQAEVEDLAPEETRTITFSNVTGDLEPGEHPVTVITDDEATVSGQLVVDQAATPALSALDIGGDGNETAIGVGTTTTVSVTLDNVGAETGSFAVTLAVGPTDERTLTVTDLQPGANATVTFEDVGANLTYAPDPYDLGVESGQSQVEGSLRVGPPPVVGTAVPQDLTGDGLYEDIRGVGEHNIFDVQTLFRNLDADPVANHPQFYNFQGSDPPEVNIFDVQALFALDVEN